MKRSFVFFSLLLFLSGCATGRLSRLEDVSPDEAAIIARIKVKYNGEDVTKGSGIAINLPSTGAPMYKYWADENGYIIGKAPLGINSIDLVSAGPMAVGRFSHIFKSKELSFELNRGQEIFYLGDITFDWHGIEYGAAQVAVGFGAIGSLATQGSVSVSVESDVSKAEEIFRKKFPNHLATIPSILIIKPTSQSQ